MRTFGQHSTLLALLFTAGSAVGQAGDAEWMSYRDGYRAMVAFEKYGKAKHLIQNHLQVVGKDKAAAPDGLQLTLQGKTMQLNLPLDATGRVERRCPWSWQGKEGHQSAAPARNLPAWCPGR